MSTIPRLAFACPARWDEMPGTDRERFCTHCKHSVVNLSSLSIEEREAILARAKTERICGTFLLRANGTMITPEAPLTFRERSRVGQFGVAALSATTLALASGCISQNKPVAGLPPPAPASVQTAAEPKISAPEKQDEEIVLLTGFIVCEPPAKPKITGFQK